MNFSQIIGGAVMSLTPVVCCLIISPVLAIGAENHEAILKDILKSWDKRQKIANSVLYNLRGHRIVLSGSYPEYPEYPGATPIKDTEYDISIELLLDFRNNRARRTQEGEELSGPTRSFIPTYNISLYDGQEYYFHEPPDKNTSDRWKPDKFGIELHLRGPNSKLMFFRDTDIPLFFGHGSILSHNLQITAQEMLRKPEISIFSEQSLIEYKGRQCLFLRTVPLFLRGKGYYEMYVDPAREGAVLRWSCYVSENLYSVDEIDYELTQRGWFPAKWTRTSFENRSAPIVQKMYVESRKFDPELKESDFKIKITPGMVVYDLTTNSDFITAGPGEPMIPLGEWQMKNSLHTKNTSGLSNFQWILIVNSLVVIGILLAYWLNRRKGNISEQD